MKRRWLALIGLIWLAGCDLPDAMPLNPHESSAKFAAATASKGHKIRGEEAGFFRVDKEVPGFGGYYFDEDGNLVAYAKELKKEKEDKLKQMLDPVLNTNKGRLKKSTGIVKVKRGDFSFPELAHWRDQLSDALLGRGMGVRLIDASESQNRVVVEVASAAAGQYVAAQMAQLSIPDSAVIVLEGDYAVFVPESPGTDFQYAVQDTIGLVGGDAIWDPYGQQWDPNSKGPTRCTLGFVAHQDGKTVLVTDSHCSKDWNSSGADGTPFYTYYGVGGQLYGKLGVETADRSFHDYCPAFSLWGLLPSLARWCRNADAALITYAPDASAPPVGYGYIRRFLRTNPDADAYRYSNYYLETDRNNPLRIGARNVTREGEVLSKSGQTTGWTQGTITKTCVDMELASYSAEIGIGPFVYSCQHGGYYQSSAGDSGAPVWAATTDGGADLRGIHWGYRYPGLFTTAG